MSLVHVDIPLKRTALPADIRRLLREADRRIQRMQFECPLPGFVVSDFVATYHVLKSLVTAEVARGSLFCEWGSGLGVVTCQAALLDFDAYGIEIRSELVDASTEFACDFGVPVEFVHGSFIGQGVSGISGVHSEWFVSETGNAYEELGIAADEFDVIFAYPWPDEEELVAELFEEQAGDDAILITYHGADEILFRRKT